MRLQAQLGYRYPRRTAIRRAVARAAASRSGAWWLARVLPTIDHRLLDLSGGRISLAELVAGTPLITLTTRGARSGVLRTHHLLGIPFAGTIAVIGTNFGRATTPAWVHNLLADSRASVSYRRARVAVLAREAAGSEYEEVFAAASRVYAGYDAYRARLAHRRPKVFVLEPATTNQS